MARHSFVCEANTLQVLSTESMFDLLMRVRRSESDAFIMTSLPLATKAAENRIMGAIVFFFPSFADVKHVS